MKTTAANRHDAKGVPIAVGARVVVMSGDSKGEIGYVRKVSFDGPTPVHEVLVCSHPEDVAIDEVHWSSWLKAKNVSVIK